MKGAVVGSVLARSQIYFRNTSASGFYRSEHIRRWYYYLALVDTLLTKPFGSDEARRVAGHVQQLANMEISGPETALLTLPGLMSSETPTEFLKQLSEVGSTLPSETRSLIESIRGHLMNGISSFLSGRGALSDRVLATLSPLVSDTDMDARNFLAKLVSAAQRFESSVEEPTLHELLEWLLVQVNWSREAAPDPPDPAQPGVTILSKVHTAKGLEWDLVFYPGIKGPMPLSGKSLAMKARVAIDAAHHGKPRARCWGEQQDVTRAESCRLAYVAMTRAKRKLYLSATQRSQFWNCITEWVPPAPMPVADVGVGGDDRPETAGADPDNHTGELRMPEHHVDEIATGPHISEPVVRTPAEW